VTEKAKATGASSVVLPPRNEPPAGPEVILGTNDSGESADPDKPKEEDRFKLKGDKRKRGRKEWRRRLTGLQVPVSCCPGPRMSSGVRGRGDTWLSSGF
jgi:hypothetical protein